MVSSKPMSKLGQLTWPKGGSSTESYMRVKKEAVYSHTLAKIWGFGKYWANRWPAESGLCYRSGFRSFCGHLDTFLETFPSYLTTGKHCNTMNPHHHDWPLFCWAMCSACKDVCGLISSWHTRTFAWRMAGRAFCSSSLPSSMLAPATITMAFSPASAHRKRCVNVQKSHCGDSLRIDCRPKNRAKRRETYD